MMNYSYQIFTGYLQLAPDGKIQNSYNKSVYLDMEKLTNVNLDMSFFSCMSLLTQLLGNNLNLKGTFSLLFIPRLSDYGLIQVIIHSILTLLMSHCK